MAIGPVESSYTPAKVPWYKKFLGLLGAIGGAISAPFTAGATIAPAATSAGLMGAIGAGAGAVGGTAGLAGALSPIKQDQLSKRVPNPNEREATITAVQANPTVPKPSALDKLTTAFNAIGSFGGVVENAAKAKNYINTGTPGGLPKPPPTMNTPYPSKVPIGQSQGGQGNALSSLEKGILGRGYNAVDDQRVIDHYGEQYPVIRKRIIDAFGMSGENDLLG